MRSADISGISPNFLELSQSQGQVAHVLLTRSPLNPPPKRRTPFDLHVLSTPPAFVLSQDQTLRRCLIPGRGPRPDRSRSPSTKGIPAVRTRHGVLPGTNFRHAVEFSKNGRTQPPANPLAHDRGDIPTLHRTPHRSDLGGSTGGFPGLATRSVLARCREDHTRLSWPVHGGSRFFPRVPGGPAERSGDMGPRRTAHRPASRRRRAPDPSRLLLRPRRPAGTGRSPAARPVWPSWGCSAPRCAGRSHP